MLVAALHRNAVFPRRDAGTTRSSTASQPWRSTQRRYNGANGEMKYGRRR